MKVRPASAAVASIVTSLLLLAGIRCTQAAEIKIVSPSAYEDIEGDGSVGEDFAALGNKPHWLVDITFRPDVLASPRHAYYPDHELRLSTTPVGPDTLSSRFDDNLGSDFMHFHRGSLTVVSDVNAAGPGPREFYDASYTAGVVTPYLYDPSQGNLLYDLIARQGMSPSPRGDQIPGIRSVLGGSPNETYGSRFGALVYQFTFVPVGDFNYNGTLDAADIDDLTIQTAGGNNPAAYDLNNDNLVNTADVNVWATKLKKTWIGDSTLDGRFDSVDFVAVFTEGKYETGGAAVWTQGDWDGSGKFDSADLVAAFSDGGYEQGVRPALASVPEPSSMLTLGVVLVACALRRPQAQ